MFLALFLFSSLSFAQQVKFFNEKTTSEVSLKHQIRWHWLSDAEGIQKNVLQVLLTSPEGWDLTRVSSGQQFKKSKSKILLNLNAISETLFFNDEKGLEVPIRIDILVNKPVVKVKDCATSDLVIKNLNKLPNDLVLGVVCQNIKGSVELHISSFSNLEWGQTSLIEVKGKGEPNRLFNLGEIQAASGSVFSFSLVRDDSEFKFEINSLKGARKKESKEDEIEKKPKFYAGAAIYSLGIQTTTASFSNTAPGIYLAAISPPLYGKLRGFMDYYFALMTSQDNTAVSFDQLHIGGKWVFDISDSFKISSGLFLQNASSLQEGSGVSLKHSNFGFLFEPTIFLEIGALKTSIGVSHLGSESVTTAMNYGVCFERKDSNWFASLEVQDFVALTSTNKEVKFSQIMAFGGLVF